MVISDIRGSTKAIENGRYQDVNTLGAASIAAVQAVFPGKEIPYVFGGDGASFLVPEVDLSQVKDVLLRLQSFARSSYAMDIRIGAVSMREISAHKQTIEVAKFELAEAKTIALIRGGGLSFAENLIKKFPEQYCYVSESGARLEPLTGLSCRWQPLHSKKGSILSILIKPASEDPGLVDVILSTFEKILEGGLGGANPVHIREARYKSLTQLIKDERRLGASPFRREFWGRFVSILISLWAFKLKGPVPFDADGYTAQIPGHSDYRKYDDMLRMILDCSIGQAEEITNYLNDLHKQKRIYFGVHRSNHALMTCLVETLQQGGHIHFIDGGDGGYAVAAKHLKDQLAKG